MRYFFDGNERWQGWWDTPNHAGAVLVLGVFLFLAIAFFSLKKKKLCWKVLGLFSYGVHLGFIFFVIQTYSRGSWVAVIAGLLMLIFVKRLRWFGIISLFVIGFLIFQHPSTTKRFQRIAWNKTDLSVTHRFIVWKGALQMIAENPWSGVGKGNFGSEYAKWYQPLDLDENYRTAINDYLTFSSEHGIIAFTLGCLAIILFFWFMFPQRYDDPLYILLLGIAAYFVCCCFSAIIFQKTIIFYFLT